MSAKQTKKTKGATGTSGTRKVAGANKPKKAASPRKKRTAPAVAAQSQEVKAEIDSAVGKADQSALAKKKEGKRVGGIVVRLLDKSEVNYWIVAGELGKLAELWIKNIGKDVAVGAWASINALATDIRDICVAVKMEQGMSEENALRHSPAIVTIARLTVTGIVFPRECQSVINAKSETDKAIAVNKMKLPLSVYQTIAGNRKATGSLDNPKLPATRAEAQMIVAGCEDAAEKIHKEREAKAKEDGKGYIRRNTPEHLSKALTRHLEENGFGAKKEASADHPKPLYLYGEFSLETGKLALTAMAEENEGLQDRADASDNMSFMIHQTGENTVVLRQNGYREEIKAVVESDGKVKEKAIADLERFEAEFKTKHARAYKALGSDKAKRDSAMTTYAELRGKGVAEKEAIKAIDG